MKSTHVKNEKEEIEFPCLMRSNENIKYKIILVSGITKKGRYKGTIIDSKEESKYKIGYFSKDWHKNSFKPLLKGEQIILEN